METIKAGTQCECAGTQGHPGHFALQCERNAVRLVTVPYKWPVLDHEQHTSTGPIYMCAACAEWHESKGA